MIFLCWKLCHLPIETGLFWPFYSACFFLMFFLILLHCLVFLIQCWIIQAAFDAALVCTQLLSPSWCVGLLLSLWSSLHRSSEVIFVDRLEYTQASSHSCSPLCFLPLFCCISTAGSFPVGSQICWTHLRPGTFTLLFLECPVLLCGSGFASNATCFRRPSVVLWANTGLSTN